MKKNNYGLQETGQNDNSHTKRYQEPRTSKEKTVAPVAMHDNYFMEKAQK